jgi:hypothetical protein
LLSSYDDKHFDAALLWLNEYQLINKNDEFADEYENKIAPLYDSALAAVKRPCTFKTHHHNRKTKKIYMIISQNLHINGSTYCLTDRTIGNNTHKRFKRPQREKCSIIDAPSNKRTT